ncbi:MULTISPECIES: hypothetical protein [unclassified Mesorhizobium]|uniref:hypothetical protein n=1 Tax=unclassified Mesorhizobium TaxID=325217 RepID=UPI00086A0B40|nr:MULTISPECIES: hypothetical protein [unclassified Mesorhizobium]MBN9256482.1 hypothetical protein [Mesorhizobium sp.]MBN9272360.1 hypothetical protein [Mesorhizobium sp.]ODT20728.1 MAG: hypothetical protein ABS57_00685 [Mesorhizobium sp. SCN 65-12]OJX74626.1 MAG: hypothetical protein BGO93_07345 [Mesorhizobium sp. 65-26]
MFVKILAASTVAACLATSAMAQSSDDYYRYHHRGPLFSSEDMTTVDPTVTGSIYNGDQSGLSTLGNTGGVGPCASSTPGPDANAGLNVNDQYCGK